MGAPFTRNVSAADRTLGDPDYFITVHAASLPLREPRDQSLSYDSIMNACDLERQYQLRAR